MNAAQAKQLQPVIQLTEPGSCLAQLVGQKAAHLAELLQAGFDVPDGTVIPISVACQWPLGSDGIVAALRDFHPGALAVRSSAVAEDLPSASFAGMYETVLDVSDPDELAKAIGAVIASATGERVRAYVGGGGDIAVLVQRMIPADAAGVAFTADPITGDRDVVVIHAVTGLGAALVDGSATPEEWRVRAEPERQHDQQVLTTEQAMAVADLARRVADYAGEPRDIEWAFARGKLWLLQARPITALPQQPEIPEPPPGVTLMKDRAHYTEPLTPFGFSTYTPALEAGMATAFEEFGMLLERLEVHNRGFELYGRAVPVGGKDGPAPPALLIGLLARVIPPLRRRMNAARDAIRSGKLEGVAEEWHDGLRQRFADEITALLAEDLDAASDAELLAHVARGSDLLGRGQLAHFRLFMPYVVSIAELGMACNDLLGWDPAQTMSLVTGLSSASSAPTRALEELAAAAGSRPKVLEVLETLKDARELEAIDAEFAASFTSFERLHGWRTLAYDPGSVALAERPELLARLILDAQNRNSTKSDSEVRAHAEAQARQALADRPEDLERFTALLEAARRHYPLREDNIALTDNFPCGVLRRALLACGRRLVANGRLRVAEDASYLTVEELNDALAPGSCMDARALVARRHAEELWVRAHPGPDLLGPPPHDPPDTKFLPAEGRRLNRALLWVMDQEMSPPEQSHGDEIRGRSGSPGKVEGRVKLVRSEAEFHKLGPGDVLVCPITSPVWSVLFGNAAALVTDGGGAMSHAAIIAREHGIPAVLATGNATARLADGDRVIVDGNAGVVTRLSS